MLSQLVFSVTYDCPVACKYCVTESGPHGGPCLDGAFMKEVIAEALRLSNPRVVVFTGGEPLIKKNEVLDTIQYASSKKLWTRIVTNSFWAGSPEKAVKMLSELKSAGLSEINLSCDDLHQENIDIANVKNAFWAARNLEMPTLVAHKRVKETKITIEYLSEYLGVKLKRFDPEKENPRFDVYSSSLTVPVGHGSKWLNHDAYILYPKSDTAWKGPCSSVLKSLIISPEQEIRMCCGMIDQAVPELTFGVYGSKPLAEIVCEANCDLIANWLALEGPYGLMRFVAGKAPDIKFKEKYVNHCHLCNDILTRKEVRAVLNRFAQEKSDEIGLKRCLLEAIRFRE